MHLLEALENSSVLNSPYFYCGQIFLLAFFSLFFVAAWIEETVKYFVKVYNDYAESRLSDSTLTFLGTCRDSISIRTAIVWISILIIGVAFFIIAAMGAVSKL